MKLNQLLFLGIETSCDETAVALVDSHKKILASLVFSQLDDHMPYGGVVPEIAARAHLKKLPFLLQEVFQNTSIRIQDIDAVCATTGPGLIGGVLVGMCYAKALALGLNKPFIPVNHLMGHALSARLSNDIPFPFLLLLISGGHTQYVLVMSPVQFIEIGSTRDDAAGEVFDKIAQLLSLPYPGGPSLEKLAQKGDALKFSLPKPLYKHTSCEMSFSGLKTAVKNLIHKHKEHLESEKPHIAASFQQTICDILAERSQRALSLTKAHTSDVKHFVIAGGVAANQKIRHRLVADMEQKGIVCTFPPLTLCTDNAAMIAWAGIEMALYKKTLFSDYSAFARPRWSLEEIGLV